MKPYINLGSVPVKYSNDYAKIRLETGGSNYSFGDSINPLRDRAYADGLPNIKAGFDEGYILSGADGADLKISRTVGHPWNTAMFADFYRDAVL